MAGYGYQTQKYGAGVTAPKSPYQPSRTLALAASGAPTVGDPFGLLTDTTDSARVAKLNGSVVTPAKPAATQAPVSVPPTQAQAPQSPQAPAAPTPASYDINTDPVLQQVNAYAGMSDAQAQASADKQRRDALLQYGSQELAKSVFSGDQNLADAAGKNPTSTLAGLAQQNTTAQHDLLNSLTSSGHNLGYSGYRVKQEGDLGQQYQNALAQAAAQEQSLLDQISGGLTSALGANNQSRIQGLQDAYGRQQAYLLANPPVAAGGDASSPDSRASGLSLSGLSAPSGPGINALLAALAGGGPAAAPSRLDRFFN